MGLKLCPLSVCRPLCVVPVGAAAVWRLCCALLGCWALLGGSGCRTADARWASPRAMLSALGGLRAGHLRWPCLLCRSAGRAECDVTPVRHAQDAVSANTQQVPGQRRPTKTNQLRIPAPPADEPQSARPKMTERVVPQIRKMSNRGLVAANRAGRRLCPAPKVAAAAWGFPSPPRPHRRKRPPPEPGVAVLVVSAGAQSDSDKACLATLLGGITWPSRMIIESNAASR